MARRQIYEPLYQAFRMFQERCLLQDRSMIWPDQSIWTLANLRQLKKLMIDAPIEGGPLNFVEKMEQQLIGAQPALWGLVADLHYIYFLPTASIYFPRRFETIGWAAKKGGLTLPPQDDPIWVPQKQGFSNTGIKYHFRFSQINLLVFWALQMKEQDNAAQILTEPQTVQKMLDNILLNIPKRGDRAYDMRHAILYLMFPDHYERIISTGRKEKIITDYGHLIKTPAKDLDLQIYQIRQAIESSEPEKVYFDFLEEREPDPDGGTSGSPDKNGTPPETNPIIKGALRLLRHFT